MRCKNFLQGNLPDLCGRMYARERGRLFFYVVTLPSVEATFFFYPNDLLRQFSILPWQDIKKKKKFFFENFHNFFADFQENFCFFSVFSL